MPRQIIYKTVYFITFIILVLELKVNQTECGMLKTFFYQFNPIRKYSLIDNNIFLIYLLWAFLLKKKKCVKISSLTFSAYRHAVKVKVSS